MTPAELRALLADALTLWGVAGRVEIAGDGVTIPTAAGTCTVAPAPQALRPIRWLVTTPERTVAGRGPRPAASIAGVLGAIREATEPG